MDKWDKPSPNSVGQSYSMAGSMDGQLNPVKGQQIDTSKDDINL